MSCNTPIKVRNKTPQGMSYNVVPCGKCPYCRLNRVRGWIMRIQKEFDRHWHGLFITLTYKVTPKSPNGLSTLRKRDFQLFMKRLRKITGYPHKYYAVGEYGSKTRRPHYHAILFGATAEQVAEAWENYVDGDVITGESRHPGEITDASIAYCAKYIDKGSVIPMFHGDDRLKEFSLMSKGMGSNYLTPAMVRYHKASKKPFIVKDGYMVPLPRYFKDQIYDDQDRLDMRREFERTINERFTKQIEEHGSEEAYIQALNARLWQDQQNRLLLSKQKRNKL